MSISNFVINGEPIDCGWEFLYGGVEYIITHIDIGKDDISFSQKINKNLQQTLPFKYFKILIERERERGQRQRQR